MRYAIYEVGPGDYEQFITSCDTQQEAEGHAAGFNIMAGGGQRYEVRTEEDE